MSAICGIFNRRRQHINSENFEKMMQTLSHRGPDGSKKWFGDSIALGHQMLYTTPESLHEKLPFYYPARELVICSDARIDNRQELFTALSIPLSRRNTITDSTLILNAYEKWGERCPDYLLGDFVFVIWDATEKKLFCARDHFGMKPLYYYISDGEFSFASEIKAVVVASDIPIILNEAAVAEFLIMRLTDNSHTFYKDIKQVPPAHTMTVYENKIKKDQYWKFEAKSRIKLSSDDAYAEALRDIIIRSTQDRIRTAFPVAIQLSGGLDSSAVACIAARKLKEQGKRLIAVSSVLPTDHPGPEYDDRNYIEIVAEQEKNIDLNWVLAEHETPFKNLKHLFEHYYEPIDDPFYYMDHSLYRTAVKNGARIVLSGKWGDMAASYNGQGALAQLFKEFHWIVLIKILRQQSKVHDIPSIKIFVRDVIKLLLPYIVNQIYFRIKNKPQNYLTKFDFVRMNFFKSALFTRILRDITRNLQPVAHTGNNIIKGTDFMSDLANTLSHDSRTGGLYSIDIPMPLLDKRIFEFCVQLPPEQFLKNGWTRSIYRRAMEGILPPQVQWRKTKHPFSPDFHRRVLANKTHAYDILLNTDNDHHINKYLNISAISRQLEKVAVCKNSYEWEIETQQVVIKGIMLISYLRWLSSINNRQRME